ncbi:MAG: Fic family protein [Bacteroidia bacterium]|nr:Fic family protein [Bacteroidia bacterium]
MNTLFAQIDTLKTELQALLPMEPERQRQLDKKFRLEFNFNSNHLEGNTLTYGETELLLIFDQTQGGHTLREYEEMKAHDVALQLIQDWAADAARPLTEASIKELNKIILVRPFWKDAITPDGQATRRLIAIGAYKQQPNSVRLANGEIFEYASVTDTPIEMGELVAWYNQEEQAGSLHPAALAALLHYRFVRIHPFDDGNGRVARLLMNYVLLRHHFPPVVIKSADKKSYLAALNRADAGDLPAFVAYIAGQLAWSLGLALKAARGESVEEAEDIDKRIALLQKELAAIDPDQEIRAVFSQEVFMNSYRSWLAALIREAVAGIQKFNPFFTGTRHSIRIPKGSRVVEFVSETPDEVAAQVDAILSNPDGHFDLYNAPVTIQAMYGTFIKGGLNTFGCNYQIEIAFETTKYKVWVDEFAEPGMKGTKTLVFERLFHQPLSTAEIAGVVTRFAATIYEHIDFYTRKNGLR